MEKQFYILNGILADCDATKPQVIIYTNPDRNEIDRLVNECNIDEHNLNSSLDAEELGRMEYDSPGNHFVFILKRPVDVNLDESEHFGVMSVGCFLFPDKLIIVCRDEVRLFDARQVIQLQTLADVLVKIIYSMINKFHENLRLINMLSESLEMKINKSVENRYLLEMFKLEKSLVYYLDSISTNGTTFRKLNASSNRLGFDEENREVLDDIMIENNQLMRQAEMYSNILTELMDARSSIINNNMNMLIRKLTIISIVFMPLNIIASMGGMSEYTVFTKKMSWPVSYGFFALGMILIGVVTYGLIKNIGFEKNGKKKFRKTLLRHLPL
jgi:magnesium transporter